MAGNALQRWRGSRGNVRLCHLPMSFLYTHDMGNLYRQVSRFSRSYWSYSTDGRTERQTDGIQVT